MVAAWRPDAPPQLVPRATARIWGTGVNPVHGTRTGEGRNTAPAGNTANMPGQLTVETEHYSDHDFGGYTMEDTQTALWGYGGETGTADRPNWGDEDGARHTTATRGKQYPGWGRRRSETGKLTGVPGGTFFRSVLRGNRVTVKTKTDFRQAQYASGANKVSAPEENVANDSDPSQIFMQTSETQRTKTRAGSQISGTASTFDAPIKSRIVGPQKFVPSGGYRHEDMRPQEQHPDAVRPFLVRTAGTGPAHWMEPNADTDNVPRNRIPPDAPYAGRDVNGDPSGYIVGDHVHGYTDEDAVY